jgi:formylmethanofuran dehydrogenase subunit D
MSEKLKVTLITGRTISQGITREGKKTLREYVESAAICELDLGDLEKLRIKEGDTVRIRTSYGTVIVRAVISTQAPHPGIVFIPMGPWANEVIGPGTDSIGMPSFKSILAEIESAPGEKVLDALTLIRGRRPCQ